MDEVLDLIFPGGAWLAVGVALGAAFARQLRPVAKEAIKYGISASERLQEVAAEALERTQDLVAEARHEAANGGPPPAPARRTRPPRPEA